MATTSPPGSVGFTLVEMLMAMLVMTVGLLGLLQSVSVAYRQSLKDKLRKEATLLAEARMHAWCRVAFDNISYGTVMSESGEKLVGGAPWKFTIARKAEKVGSRTAKLEVDVIWMTKGETATHQIFTLRTRRTEE